MLGRQVGVTDSELSNLIRKSTIPEPQSKEIPDLRVQPDEQTKFFESLREIAKVENVKLSKFDSIPAKIIPQGQPTNIPDDVLPFATLVTVKGPFENEQRFLIALQELHRLMNITDVEWRPVEKSSDTELVFTLTRYVTLKAGPAPEPPKESISKNFVDKLSQ